MPFVGFGYAIAMFLPLLNNSTTLLMNYVQIFLLILSNLMLAKLIKLKSYERIGFILLSSVTYTTLLFSIMMEQYIIAYFWLIFFIYNVCENKKADDIALTAASGTLLTSMVLIPYTSTNFSIKKIKNFIYDMKKSCITFLLFMIVFGRLDVFLNLPSTLLKLFNYTGKDVTILNKLLQYFSFIANCFITPDTEIKLNKVNYISWQLKEVKTMNILGIVILGVAFLGFILNRKKKISQISMLWVSFSTILLGIIGWGAAENGMILYSLYFGWAFLILNFQFIKSILEKLKINKLLPYIIAIFTIILFIINYSGMKDLLEFAFTYYPK